MNKHDLHTLDFTNLYFEEGMSDLTDFIGSQDTKIQSITLKDCKIPDNTLRKLIEDFKKLTSLRELRLIKMNMKEHVNSILGDMHSYKHLQLLDLSDNGITNMREISTMLANNASIQQLILKGNTVETIEDFRYLLMGMTANISLVHLEYDIQQALVDPSFKGVCA
jgi:Leucine-rich repeat (LRR) protein